VAFLYETHVHTRQSSACGVSSGREYIRPYLDLGYTGIMITDHFYRGNTAIDRSFPWNKWVNEFCRGFEDAQEEGYRLGLDVFFGWEETFEAGDDYLVFGLDKKWLLEHPEAKSWSRREQYETVKKAGGCVIQAHPFRQRAYIRCIYLSTGCVDAVEIVNMAHNDLSNDALAAVYAKKTGLPVTAGSDMHFVNEANPQTVSGIYLDNKLSSVSDFVQVILNNKIAGLKADPDRWTIYGNEKISLPVDIRNKQDRSTYKDIWDYLDL